MPLRTLRSMYEKRKTVLQDTLRRDNKLDKSRKDQMIGAIAEIEALLKTIDSLREQEIRENEKLEVRSQGIKIEIPKKKVNLIEKIHEKIVKFDSSKTRDNLLNVFVRKCETRTKYEFYAKKARDEGYESIANVFYDLAEHEKQHARLIFKYIGMDNGTLENIRDASDIERNYHGNLYIEFEKVAEQENFKEYSEFFKELAEIEAEHEKTFLKLLKRLHEKKIFSSEYVVKWKCRNCGHTTESKEAPKKCRVCKHAQSFFEIVKE